MADLLEGAAEFEKALGSLPKKMSKKIVRRSVRMAQKPVHASAKSNAEAMIGGEMGALIAKNTKIKSPKKQKRGQYLLSVRTGDDPGLKDTAADGAINFIPAAIEFGHGKNKEQAAIPYLRSAADTNKARSLRIFKTELRNGIDKAIREATNAR